ncbi:MAG: alpha-glucan family phosphorylase [Pseudomonadales bacterium]
MDLDEFINEARVAYFSMEIALRADIPTYSGGLGVLAGDTMRTCADLELRLVAISLVAHEGYFRQEIDAEGRQQEYADEWSPAKWTRPLQAKITVPIEGRSVWVGGWLYIIEAAGGGRQPVILLDTDLYENEPEDRKITDRLYGGGDDHRLRQEVVLGIGGVRMLQALGFEISRYHMNEGHSALLALELLRRGAVARQDLRRGESPYNVIDVREMCSFTTHTPVEAGHDKFAYGLVDKILHEYIDTGTLRTLAGEDRMNMTRLALNLSESVNGVTKRHASVTQQIFPDYYVRGITNGVHPFTWTSPHFAKLYDEYLPGWRHEPELLVRADCCISDDALWQAHMSAKTDLAVKVKELVAAELDPDVPTLGFARRMTAYKRPDLLFSDLDRLREIARQTPFQLVLSGKAHPADIRGKHLVEKLHQFARDLAGDLKVVFLPNYDMNLAASMVAGVDVWLNTPLPPLEASGTSGMKAAFNGVPNLSILDGWWIEGCIEGITGWAVGDDGQRADPDADASDLYDKLQRVVLPLYYGERAGWVGVMKGAIAKNASFFNSHRMMRRYVTEIYIR